MVNDIDSSILEFMKQQALEGCFESSTRELANGAGLAYNQVVKALERLKTKDQIRFRTRGTESRPVLYYYLREILELCREKWKNE